MSERRITKKEFQEMISIISECCESNGKLHQNLLGKNINSIIDGVAKRYDISKECAHLIYTMSGKVNIDGLYKNIDSLEEKELIRKMNIIDKKNIQQQLQ